MLNFPHPNWDYFRGKVKVIKHLDDARRQAPFITKWKAFPEQFNPSADLAILLDLGQASLNQFFGSITVERLDYKNTDLAKVMDWYEKGEAPFAMKGAKKKEFPDALAFELVQKRAASSFSTVAVVSSDKDFQRACERFSYVLYVDSLPKVTQNLLTETDKVDALLSVVEDHIEVLEQHLLQIIENVPFFDYSDMFEIEEVDVRRTQMFELAIIGLGDGGECTVYFYANIDSELKVRWDSELPPPKDVPSGTFTFQDDTAVIGGSAKLTIKDGKIVNVGIVILDDDEIFVMGLPREQR